jgi:hypothetical protein
MNFRSQFAGALELCDFSPNPAQEGKMPNYMTQKMSSGTKKATTYYRKQTIEHPDHTETSKFTTDAKADYATTHGVEKDHVEEGKFAKNQGVPTSGDVKNI